MKGIIVFGAASVIVLLIGLILYITNNSAQGIVGGGKFSTGSFASLGGIQVMSMGAFMLVLTFFLYLMVRSDRNK